MDCYMYAVRIGTANPIALFNTYDKALEYAKRYKPIYKSLVNVLTYVVYAYENDLIEDCGQKDRPNYACPR